nr:terminase TerL endonuclease subunit [Corynebacterium auriscanis]
MSAPGGADRNRKFSQEVEVVRALIDDEGLDGPFRHDGDPALVAHVNNTRTRWNKFGLTVGKKTRDSTQLVDLCVAMIAANVGRREALNSGKVRAAGGRRKRRKVLLA